MAQKWKKYKNSYVTGSGIDRTDKIYLDIIVLKKFILDNYPFYLGGVYCNNFDGVLNFFEGKNNHV